jgi:hypothetical protein
MLWEYRVADHVFAERRASPLDPKIGRIDFRDSVMPAGKRQPSALAQHEEAQAGHEDL